MKVQGFIKHPEQPHFDDEMTLIAARPVVPLTKIEAKERHRRHWRIGGAFALAMVLGAASALLASYFRLRNVATVAAEMPEVEAPAAAVTETVESTTPVAIDVNVPASLPPKKARAPRSQKDALERSRETVLVEEWQERRARRATRRERRNNQIDNPNRDLSNLNEIFEGPRQP